MFAQTDTVNLNDIAADVISALDDHRQIPAFSDTHRLFRLADAYRLIPLLRSDFEARGERITGRKIGFTNREMWKVHGVEAPIWGYCTDRTTQELSSTTFRCAKDFVEPRIEPEIIFGLAKAPLPSMDPSALLDCIEWISLGYEVVQSIYPGWKFTASDTVAANALHGALLIGNRHPVAPRKAAWQDELATFRAELYCNGKLIQTGGGAFVLDSPLLALRHLVELLDNDPHNPQLGPGEIVSTGTLTLAMPVNAGESWKTRVRGIALEDITLDFER
jgi:2-oxo-3-hexenedioate decarboxylase